MTEIDMTKPLSKETEALMAMQYDGMNHSHVKNKIKLRFLISAATHVQVTITRIAIRSVTEYTCTVMVFTGLHILQIMLKVIKMKVITILK